MILAVVFGIAIVILVAYLFSVQKQLRSVNMQLKKRLEENKLQPISIELINKNLNNLTMDINRLLKKEEDWEIQRTREEKNFKEMIANISHDLRTPLTAIKGYQQLIRSEELSEKQKEKLTIAEKNTDKLSDLIDHFFEYSYTLNAERDLKYEKVEVSHLIADCLAGYVSLFEDRDLKIKFETDSFAYSYIDREAGMRIVQNLIKNAAQYSAGDVTIRIYVSDVITLIFSNVVDHHVDVEHIFNRFYTEDETRSRNRGLGLSIVKLLTEQMGGEAYADFDRNILSIIISFPKYDEKINTILPSESITS